MSGETLTIPRPAGMARLGPREMLVEDGARTQSFRYADAESLRLSFRPRSLAFNVYRLDLRMKDGRTLRLHNIDATPGALFRPYRRWDEGYARLAREVTRRVGEAAPQAALAAGFPALRWTLSVLVGAGALAFVALRGAQALLAGHGAAALTALIGAAILAAFLAPFLIRNRPRRLAPGAVPPQVLPPAPL